LDGTGRSRLLESDQGPPRALGYVVDMNESPPVTIVYDPGEDGPIVASIPEVHGAHGHGRTCEEAQGERDRRKAEATHSA
jgi:hypothetical protein